MPGRRGSEPLTFFIKQLEKSQISTVPEEVTKLAFRAVRPFVGASLRQRSSDEGLTLEMSASLSLHGGSFTIINLFDAKFLCLTILNVQQLHVNFIDRFLKITSSQI